MVILFFKVIYFFKIGYWGLDSISALTAKSFIETENVIVYKDHWQVFTGLVLKILFLFIIYFSFIIFNNFIHFIYNLNLFICFYGIELFLGTIWYSLKYL